MDFLQLSFPPYIVAIFSLLFLLAGHRSTVDVVFCSCVTTSVLVVEIFSAFPLLFPPSQRSVKAGERVDSRELWGTSRYGFSSGGGYFLPPRAGRARCLQVAQSQRQSDHLAGDLMAAAPAASLLSSPSQRSLPLPVRCAKAVVRRSSDRTVFPAPSAGSFLPGHLHICHPKKQIRRISQRISAVAVPAVEEMKECILPTWAEFDIGRAPVYWKTMNGLPPMSGEKLTIFYNPAASKLVPNDEFGIAFNGGFNQPIMCGSEPRAMTKKTRGKADPPIYTIKICIPKHAVNLIFSFTNGVEWDGPYKLQFQVLRRWRNNSIEFFNAGLAEELSQEGACERAIFPDSNVVVTRCAMIANLSAEGGDRCDLNLVAGCMDPSSPLFDPLANVDDGSCLLDSDSEDETSQA